jgi:hypothetical protein
VTNKNKDNEGKLWGGNGKQSWLADLAHARWEIWQINLIKLGQLRRVRGWLEVASYTNGYARMKRHTCGEASRAPEPHPLRLSATVHPPSPGHRHVHVLVHLAALILTVISYTLHAARALRYAPPSPLGRPRHGGEEVGAEEAADGG